MPSDQRHWTPDRYPIAFHEVLKAGEGRIEFKGTRWTPNTARKRWFSFVKAAKDTRVWTARIEGGWLVLASHPREAVLIREALAGRAKNLPGGG